MKKLTFIFLLFSIFGFSQDFREINRRLDQLLQNRKIDKAPINVDLTQKKFIIIYQTNKDISREIIEFKENNEINIIHITENKETKKSQSKIYTGNVIRRNNLLSIRADKLENQNLDLPLVYSFMLQKREGNLILINVNNNEKWIDTNAIKIK